MNLDVSDSAKILKKNIIKASNLVTSLHLLIYKVGTPILTDKCSRFVVLFLSKIKSNNVFYFVLYKFKRKKIESVTFADTFLIF